MKVVASVEGLLGPALKSGGVVQTGLGLLGGVVFLLLTRWMMRGRDVQVGELRGRGVRHSALVFALLLVYGFPEGMAMGAAQASDVDGLSLFILTAIAAQNVPEGVIVAIPIASAGCGKVRSYGKQC